MGKFDNQLERMKSLMTYGMVSESDNHNVRSMEYKSVAADGKTYGIIRECNKYYIKVAQPGKEKLVEGFDYVGGFMNKNEHEYSSFANALKQLELKLKSINEAYDVKVNIETLDPYRKENLVIEGTQKMKDEIARQRQIMNNVSALMNESAQIGMNNTGNPEAPKTSGLDTAKSAPFTDKAEAKLDTDLKATANNPEKQGEPFETEVKPNMDGDAEHKASEPEKQGEPFGEKAQYVPDNSVADKKPAGGKVVKVNEGVEDEYEVEGEDEDLLLDDESEEMPEEPMMDDEFEGEEEFDSEEMPEDEEFEDDEDFDFEDFDSEGDDMIDGEDEEMDLMARIEALEAELAQLRAEVNGEEGEEIPEEPMMDDEFEGEEEFDLEEMPEDEVEMDDETEEMPEEEEYEGEEEEEEMPSDVNESITNLLNRIVKEEITKLNVFGKHPGYRKKPMALPKTGEDKNQWGEDWNDESVYSEQPFGEKIGSSAPFEKVVEKISEMVYNDVKKKL